MIAARVQEDTKLRFRALAARQQLTESVLLKRLVSAALQAFASKQVEQIEAPLSSRVIRTCVRLAEDDLRLLVERARSRQMPTATYVSVLVRSHLRQLAPLPTAELVALKRCISELNAIGRNVNQLARAVHQGGGSTTLTGEYVRHVLRVCGEVRGEIKRLVIANTASWEVGHEASHE